MPLCTVPGRHGNDPGNTRPAHSRDLPQQLTSAAQWPWHGGVPLGTLCGAWCDTTNLVLVVGGGRERETQINTTKGNKVIKDRGNIKEKESHVLSDLYTYICTIYIGIYTGALFILL